MATWAPGIKQSDVEAKADNVRADANWKAYELSRPIFENMITTYQKRKDRVGDLDLIYSLSTILDPDSVVRSSDQVLVEKAQGLPGEVQGWISYINGGGTRFDDETRRRILELAHGRTRAYKTGAQSLVASERDWAKRYGVNPEDVARELIDPTDVAKLYADEDAAKGVAAATAATEVGVKTGKPPSNAPKGTTFKDPATGIVHRKVLDGPNNTDGAWEAVQAAPAPAPSPTPEPAPAPAPAPFPGPTPAPAPAPGPAPVMPGVTGADMAPLPPGGVPGAPEPAPGPRNRSIVAPPPAPVDAASVPTPRPRPEPQGSSPAPAPSPITPRAGTVTPPPRAASAAPPAPNLVGPQAGGAPPAPGRFEELRQNAFEKARTIIVEKAIAIAKTRGMEAANQYAAQQMQLLQQRFQGDEVY